MDDELAGRRRLRAAFTARVTKGIWLDHVRRAGVGARLAELERAQVMPKAALQREQAARLRQLIDHARATTAFYSRRLKALPRDDADLPRWLAEVPPLTRADLQNHIDDLRSSAPRGAAHRSASGGSTGEPVRFWVDDAMAAASAAVEEFFFAKMGVGRGEPRVRVWGSVADIRGQGATWRRRLREAVLDDHIVGCFAFDDATVRAIVATLWRRRPRLIIGYASGVAGVCRGARDLGLALPPVHAVCVSAEPLTAEARALIAEGFAAKVFDRYGTRELGAVACEFVPGGPKVWSPLHHIIEALRPDGTPCAPGEEGDLVVTVLQNHAQPFIRYAVGDRGAVEPGDAALAWPRLSALGGRSVDQIITPSGRMISPLYFVHMLGVELNRGEVAAVQLEQVAIDALVVRFVPAIREEAALRAFRARVEAELRPVVGQEMALRWQEVADIPKGASGKVRYVINSLPPDQLPRGGLR